MKILISDSLSEEGINILKQEKTFQVDVHTKLTPEQLLNCAGEYIALIVRSSTKVTKEVISAGKNLKYIGRAGVGVDNIDVDAATKKGIVVINTPGGNTISTAEHTFSMMLALSRNIPQANISLKSGVWDRKKWMGVELQGKTIGIIGLGRIGTEVAKRASVFGMRVLAYDPFISLDKASKMDIELVQLNTLLDKADYITVHVPLTEETKYIIGAKELSITKKGVRIINCARGGIIDETALAEAIKSKQVAGAAFDVYEKEPPQKEHPFYSLENVIMTPHLGASTEEAQAAVAVEIAYLIKDALTGKGIKNAVNIPSLGIEAMKGLEPYLYLAEKIGLIQAQILTGYVSEVSIVYSGDVSLLDVGMVSRAAIKGFLTPVVGSSVNYVNAMIIAQERDLKIVESKSTTFSDFANLISVCVQTDKVENTVAGTLFTKKNPRIVKINQFYVDVSPSGNMLLIDNIDVPGIVGSVGSILGKNNINIAGMTFGREKPGGKAITVLNIDSAVPDNILEQIKNSKNITGVKLIKLSF